MKVFLCLCLLLTSSAVASSLRDVKLVHHSPDRRPQKKATGLHDPPGSNFKGFLLNNILPNTSTPRSFALEPPNYFDTVPANLKPQHYTTSHYIPQCGNESISAANMNAYMFQTETLLTALGLNIYDGAMWCLAVSLLGEAETCYNYTQHYLVEHKTVQFPDIRGDAVCQGVMEWGQCTDPWGSGYCGFCYGDGSTNADKTLTVENAYFFRLISDYWAIEGTIDARCPARKQPWIWNDYKPILGENAWANYLGPLHNAMIRYNNNVDAIPDDDACFTLGIALLEALQAMKVGDTGAIYYTPRNTWFGFGTVAQNIGSTFSIENQGSLYAGLRSLNWLLTQRTSTAHKEHLPTIQSLIKGLQKIILRAWNSELKFFRQGGTYHTSNQSITWGQNGEPIFAVDCQTWVSSVLGTKVVDTAFGELAAYNLWQTVKARAGYNCSGAFCGVGYTDTNISGAVFSGEWTYGAMNWLNIMIADSGYNETIIASLQADVENMAFGLETYLVTSTYLNNGSTYYDSVLYANERYYIPFGWYANPLPATSSTAWAVALAQSFNPFSIDGGKYTQYPDGFDTI